MSITVEYIDHSGYVVETPNMIAIFDFVNGHLPSTYLTKDKPVIFFVSHSHADHYSSSVFSYRKTVVISNDIDLDPLFDVCKVGVGDSLNVQGIGVQVFGSTDAGVSYLVQDQDIHIFFAGDLNMWHWKDESDEDEVQLATMQFLNIAHSIKKFHIDVALFPVDERMKTDFDEGAREFIRLCKPKHFFPMHFGSKRAIEPFYEWARNLEDTLVYPIEQANTVYTIEALR